MPSPNIHTAWRQSQSSREWHAAGSTGHARRPALRHVHCGCGPEGQFGKDVLMLLLVLLLIDVLLPRPLPIVSHGKDLSPPLHQAPSLGILLLFHLLEAQIRLSRSFRVQTHRAAMFRPPRVSNLVCCNSVVLNPLDCHLGVKSDAAQGFSVKASLSPVLSKPAASRYLAKPDP